MRDLALVGFLFIIFVLGLRRPFMFVLGYVYIDIVSPQRLSYYLLNSIPISLIFFLAAFLGWLVIDDKRGTRFSSRQLLLVLLLAWAGWTTWNADFPVQALEKWSWVWKSLVFAIFLPLVLRTRLRIEALLLFMILSASSLVITGGIKTLVSGGGYGELNLGVADNSNLYEGSTISTVAVAIIPLILFLARYGTIFPREWKVRLYATALIFACLLIPVGTAARTGLICIGALAILMLRDTKRRFLYMAGVAMAVAVAVPFLPASYTQRMHTIQGYQADASAGTRLAVWKWTWDYVQDHPFGGGFNCYLQNHLTIHLADTKAAAGGSSTSSAVAYDQARAFHSSYFEMLGEQGWPGFLMWILLNLSGIFQMSLIRRRYRHAGEAEAWIAPLAGSLQIAHIIYMIGSLFVGIAFESFVYMLIGLQIGLSGYCQRTRTPPGKSWGDAAGAPALAPRMPAVGWGAIPAPAGLDQP
ncbi:MAG TPA: putative O-glycosylation ligase, exosortase A system-associated [Sphingomonas sp.]